MARPSNGAPKKGKKNRKHGRNKNSAAMKRYNAENRCEKNKARRARRAGDRMMPLRATAVRRTYRRH